jgi:hypothetical protein
MHGLNQRIIRWSRNWWALLAWATASLLSLQSLFYIGERFAAVTSGYRPFDLQNPLGRDDILAQLPAYTATSRSLYWVFIGADMIFPVVAAMPLVLLLAKALQAIGRPWATLALGRGFALTPLLIAALDWVENAFFVATVALYPQDITGWAAFAAGTKVTKLSLIGGCNITLVSLAVYAGVRLLLARRQHAPEHPTTGR